MNKRQLIAMWAGIGIIVLIALFPPTSVMHLDEAGKDLLRAYSFSALKSSGEAVFQPPVFLFTEGAKEIQYKKMNYSCWRILWDTLRKPLDSSCDYFDVIDVVTRFQIRRNKI